mmetsp:Transcript_773/g.2549  ORF Transcript_773/g.2549 Transcript_773/m.2549 type:complete len:260 (-) Transcript_773:1154-1933(-)
MLLENTIRTFSRLAKSWALEAVCASKARITAYSGSRFSRITAARFTSFCWTSPTPASSTGMFLVCSMDSNASSFPSSLAFTRTPVSCRSKPAKAPWSSAWASCFSLSKLSSPPTMWRCVPATTVSKPAAKILVPMDLLTDGWLVYFGLARVSVIGWGVKRPLMVVTTGPPEPASTIRSPSRRQPFFKRTSAVMPRSFLPPARTSNTTHSNSSRSSRLSTRRSCARLANRYRRSGIPCPVAALVGTKDTVLPRSFLSMSQ